MFLGFKGLQSMSLDKCHHLLAVPVVPGDQLQSRCSAAQLSYPSLYLAFLHLFLKHCVTLPYYVRYTSVDTKVAKLNMFLTRFSPLWSSQET